MSSEIGRKVLERVNEENGSHFDYDDIQRGRRWWCGACSLKRFRGRRELRVHSRLPLVVAKLPYGALDFPVENLCAGCCTHLARERYAYLEVF